MSDPAIFDPAVVITNYEYRFRVAEQLREIGAEATILLEPERRDSAAAAWAAASDPKAVVAVLAADHVFEDGKQFAQLCAQAYAVADTGEIVTFGVTPDHPATGYGYIHPGGPRRTHACARAVSLVGRNVLRAKPANLPLTFRRQPDGLQAAPKRPKVEIPIADRVDPPTPGGLSWSGPVEEQYVSTS